MSGTNPWKVLMQSNRVHLPNVVEKYVSHEQYTSTILLEGGVNFQTKTIKYHKLAQPIKKMIIDF